MASTQHLNPLFWQGCALFTIGLLTQGCANQDGNSDPFDVKKPSYLAYGWCADSKKPFMVGPQAVIFQETDDSFDRLEIRNVHAYSKTAESVFDFAATVQGEIGGSAIIWIPCDPQFQGKCWLPFPAAADSNINGMGAFKYNQFRFDKFVESQFASLVPKKLNRHEDLLPEAKRILLDAPVETIQSKLGDFYAMNIRVGGLMQLTVATDLVGAASKLGGDIEGSVTAHIQQVGIGVGASGGAAVTVETNVKHQRARTRLTVLGGDTRVWLKINANNTAEVQEEWAQSVTSNNEHPIGFTLVPIWDLLNHDDMDRQKASDLKTYMMNKWNNANQKIPAYPPAPEPPDECFDNKNIPGSDWWPTCWGKNLHGVQRRRQHCQCDTGYEPDGLLKCKKCKE